MLQEPFFPLWFAAAGWTLLTVALITLALALDNRKSRLRLFWLLAIAGSLLLLLYTFY